MLPEPDQEPLRKAKAPAAPSGEAWLSVPAMISAAMPCARHGLCFSIAAFPSVEAKPRCLRDSLVRSPAVYVRTRASGTAGLPRQRANHGASDAQPADHGVNLPQPHGGLPRSQAA